MSKEGFTLVELFIVLGIMVIVVSGSLVALKNLSPSMRLKGVTRNLAEDIRFGKRVSIEIQKNHSVCFTKEPDKYWIVKGEDCTGSSLRKKTLPEEISFSELNLEGGKVKFNPYGSAVYNGSLILEGEEKTKEIQIRPSGFVKIK